MTLKEEPVVSQVVTYREAGRQLLAQARAELDAGDLRQASEKAWGAAAQMVKAAAQARGWPHNAHRDLWTGIRDLTNEIGDPDIHSLFASAHYLHGNFYENAFDAEMVRHHLDRVGQFIAKLEGLLDG